MKLSRVSHRQPWMLLCFGGNRRKHSGSCRETLNLQFQRIGLRRAKNTTRTFGSLSRQIKRASDNIYHSGHLVPPPSTRPRHLIGQQNSTMPS